jgi:hypothetical protein
MPRLAIALAGTLTIGAAVLAQSAPPPTAPPPVPKPFPGAVKTPPDVKPPSPTEKTAPGSQTRPELQARPGTAPIHPQAQLLDTFDAGRGQQYLIYGTDLPYPSVVEYYKQLLRTGGNEIFRAPAMHRFDLARFDENTMAYPPSIVIKDYTWNGSPGYLHVDGSTERRYRTIIQVVPVK